jgi:hypothetical protein
MVSKVRFPAVVVALAALAAAVFGSTLAGGATAPPGAARAPSAFVLMQYFGVVAVTQGPTRGRGRAVASLHGLEPGTAYEAAGVTKPCSVDLDEEGVESALVFELSVPAGQGDDALVARPVALSRGVARVRSLRLYTGSGDKFKQVACHRAAIGAGGAGLYR